MTSSHINKLEKIRLGGTEQWIRIRGNDTLNPILLLIQQGPGFPMLNEAADAEKQWHLENDFVVIYWDQRGCGKSFSTSIPPQSMTLDQMITDTDELIRALTQRFEVANLYILGFSQGGAIAALVAARHPDLVRAVVGVCPALWSSIIRRWKRPKESSLSGSRNPRICPNTRNRANFERSCSRSSASSQSRVLNRDDGRESTTIGYGKANPYSEKLAIS